MKTIIKILYVIFPFLHLFDKRYYMKDLEEPIVMPIILSGKKLKCTRDYPLKSIKVTKGKIYDVVDEYTAEKRISSYATIPLNFKSIVNDDGEVVLITPHFFEEV